MRGGWPHILRRDEGSVLVLGAAILLVMAGLGIALIEGAQWFQHRRHLQVRVDAAALAGAQDFNACFNPSISASTAEDLIEQDAFKYAGVPKYSNLSSGSDYNTGWQNFDISHDGIGFQFDGKHWPNPDGTIQHGTLPKECTSPYLLDVTLTQKPPRLLSLTPIPGVPTIRARARVQLQEIQSLTPSMPLAIPDVRPQQVAVTFVNNATGAALAGCANGCVFQLVKPATSSGQLNIWKGTATISMPAANGNVGMRVGIGTNVGSCAGVNAVYTSTANYVCYDYSTTGQASPSGIIDLRSYDASPGSQTVPVLHEVTPITCAPSSPFFSIYSASTGSCTSGISATVYFGGTLANPSSPPAGAQVEATIDGQTTQLTNSPAGSTTWSANAWSLPLEGGPYPVTMAWCLSKCSQKSNFTPFAGGATVQQIYSGSDGSSSVLPGGPIFAATLFDTNGGAPYSYAANQSVTLAVDVGLTGGVHLATPCLTGCGSGASYKSSGDPPVLLRFTTGSGNDSQTYAIDCGTVPGHTGGGLYQQIAYGCANAFSINYPDLCPDLSNPSPPDCAPVQTGAATGQVQQGMNDRFVNFSPYNGQCAPNNYPNYPSGDGRIVTLIITDFSAFSGSGNGDVPVVTYATFYVTGWDGADASCKNLNEPPPPTDAKNGQGSNIWGHFIADVNFSGKPNGNPCQGGVAPCVAVLVR